MAWPLRISRPTLAVTRTDWLSVAPRVHGLSDRWARYRAAAVRLSVAAGAVLVTLLWLVCVALLVQEMVSWWAEFAVYPLQTAGAATSHW